MGWNDGKEIFSKFIETLLNNGIDFEDRVHVYTDLIDFFENEDCDTLDECIKEDEAFEKAWYIVKGEDIEEETEHDDELWGFGEEDFYDEHES